VIALVNGSDCPAARSLAWRAVELNEGYRGKTFSFLRLMHPHSIMSVGSNDACDAIPSPKRFVEVFFDLTRTFLTKLATDYLIHIVMWTHYMCHVSPKV
jgi:hypothetical protein